MLKNLSDYISLFVLIFLVINVLRFLLVSITPEVIINEEVYSIRQLLKDYLNNTDE